MKPNGVVICRSRPVRPSTAAFTLTEVMVATTLLAIATSLTMVVFIAALKRSSHAEDLLGGASELRRATDVISQAVRSSPQLPTVVNTADGNGLQLLVAPKTLAYLTVDDRGTWIDAAHTVRGSKSGQKLMAASVTVPVVIGNLFSGISRPTGALSTASDVAAYFITAAPNPKVSDVLKPGNTVSIPATSFGAAIPSITVNSVSNNAGNATITYVTNLGVSVPDGTTPILITSQRARFEVCVMTKDGSGKPTKTELRYYPDTNDVNHYSVLARDISTTPLSDPTNSASAQAQPFTISNTSTNYVVINLQKIPKGTLAGRTVQGVQTTVYKR